MTTRAPAVLKIKAYVSLFFLLWHISLFRVQELAPRCKRKVLERSVWQLVVPKVFWFKILANFPLQVYNGLEIIDDGIIILINTSSLLECLPDLPSLTLWDGGGANSGACSLKSISSDSFQHSEQEYELIIINNIFASRRKAKFKISSSSDDTPPHTGWQSAGLWGGK